MPCNTPDTLLGDDQRHRCPNCLAVPYSTTEGYDSLTGLLSHRAFLGALSRARGQCRRRNEPLTLMLIDVDRFGRSGDVVSRDRWDRFAVALPGACEAQTCRIARRWAERLFSRPVDLGGLSIAVQASFGVAESSPGFVEPQQDLIEQAEQALLVAKQRGGRCIVGFSEIPHDVPSRQRLDRAPE